MRPAELRRKRKSLEQKLMRREDPEGRGGEKLP